LCAASANITICEFEPVSHYRPQRRRLEAFTTDSQIIQVQMISRHVAIFPAAAALQIFDSDCIAANLKKIPG